MRGTRRSGRGASCRASPDPYPQASCGVSTNGGTYQTRYVIRAPRQTAQPSAHRLLQSGAFLARGRRCYDDFVEIAERQAIVLLTEAAAGKIRELMAEESADDVTVLRVAVQGGGCSGFEYALG